MPIHIPVVGEIKQSRHDYNPEDQSHHVLTFANEAALPDSRNGRCLLTQAIQAGLESRQLRVHLRLLTLQLGLLLLQLGPFFL